MDYKVAVTLAVVVIFTGITRVSAQPELVPRREEHSDFIELILEEKDDDTDAKVSNKRRPQFWTRRQMTDRPGTQTASEGVIQTPRNLKGPKYRNDWAFYYAFERTNWGTWGDWEFCPKRSYAIGVIFINHSPPSTLWTDDTSANGIGLICSDESTVFSKRGTNGNRREIKRCNSGRIIAVNLLVERPLSADSDDTATNGVSFLCGEWDGRGHLRGGNGHEFEGNGWGDWGVGKWSYCDANQAICGIRTQVEDYVGPDYDHTGLNGVHFACCKL